MRNWYGPTCVKVGRFVFGSVTAATEFLIPLLFPPLRIREGISFLFPPLLTGCAGTRNPAGRRPRLPVKSLLFRQTRASDDGKCYSRTACPSRGGLRGGNPLHKDSVLITTLLLILLPSAVFAEYYPTVTGSVRDTSGASIQGVHVSIEELSMFTATDSDGEFIFNNVPSGKYQIQIGHIGFSSVQENIQVIVYEGYSGKLDLVMVSKTLILQEAESISKFSGMPLQSAQSISIPRQYWESRGSETLGDVLRDIPGVSIRKGDGVETISLRGSPVRAVKVELDGIPLNDPATGAARIDQVELSNLKSIVLTFQGYGGHVALKTFDLKGGMDEADEYGISGNAASFESYSTGSHARLSLQSTTLKLFLNHRQSSGNFPYLLNEGIRKTRLNNHSRQLTGNFTVKQRFEYGFIALSILKNSNFRGIPGILHVAPTPEASLEDNLLSVSLQSMQKIFASDITFNSFLLKNSSRFTSPQKQYNPDTNHTISKIAEDYEYDTRIYGFKSCFKKQVRKHEVSIGYEVQSDEYRGFDLIRNTATIGGMGLGYTRRITQNIPVNLSYHFRLSDWEADFSTFMNYFSVSNQNLENSNYFAPNIRLDLSRKWKSLTYRCHLGWGRSFLPPAFNALFLVENVFAVSNKNLNPERGESFSTGFQMIKTSGLVPCRMNINLYRSVMIDMIIWKVSSMGKYYPENESRVSISGMEIIYWFSLIRDLININSQFELKDASIETAGDINRGNIPPMIPRYAGSVDIGLRSGIISTHLRGRWVSRRYSTASNLDPISTAGMGLTAYSVYDFYNSIKFEKGRIRITLDIGIDNLFDESFRVVERTPMPGRSFRMVVKLRCISQSKPGFGEAGLHENR